MIKFITMFDTPITYNDSKIQQLESRTLTRPLVALYDNNYIDINMVQVSERYKALNDSIFKLTRDNLSKGEQLLLQAYEQLQTETAHNYLTTISDDNKLELIKSSNIARVYKLQ